MFSGPIRGGTRGGQGDFKWTDVAEDKDRENYLGHSILAPVGRWQKNRDITWYDHHQSKKSEEDQIEEKMRMREKEIREIKLAEEEALSLALGFKPSSRSQISSSSNLTELGNQKKKSKEEEEKESEEERIKEKERRMREKKEKLARRLARSERRKAKEERHLKIKSHSKSPIRHQDESDRVRDSRERWSRRERSRSLERRDGGLTNRDHKGKRREEYRRRSRSRSPLNSTTYHKYPHPHHRSDHSNSIHPTHSHRSGSIEDHHSHPRSKR